MQTFLQQGSSEAYNLAKIPEVRKNQSVLVIIVGEQIKLFFLLDCAEEVLAAYTEIY